MVGFVETAVGNEEMNLASPLKETTSWMAYTGHSLIPSFPASLAPAIFVLPCGLVDVYGMQPECPELASCCRNGRSPPDTSEGGEGARGGETALCVCPQKGNLGPQGNKKIPPLPNPTVLQSLVCPSFR